MRKKQTKDKEFLIIPGCILILLLLTFGGGLLCTRMLENQQWELTLDVLSMEEYQSIFLSMYDISTFSEEDFTTYRGVPTTVINNPPESADQVNKALDAVFSSGNQITNIYLGLDPLLLWNSEKKDFSRVEKSFESGWLSYADAHPEITFEILLPFPSMDHWLSLEDEELQASLTLYSQLASFLSARANITVYYVGGQEWLISNPGNYVSAYVTNESVTQKLFLLTFCDHSFQMTAENSEMLMQQTSDLIAAAKDSPAVYPDLSGYDIVMMGDSIIGNYAGSISIPGVVSGLSSASAYNCAQGGTSASKQSSGDLCFPDMAKDFVNGTVSNPESNYGQGIQSYLDADHTDKKLVFVINFGLNDYFDGHSPENPEDAYDIFTYAGAMRTGIRTLQENYPDSTILIMGPGRVTYFDNGTETEGENGGTLSDYYELSAALAEELDVDYLDIYQDFPEGNVSLTDVLADGCHYNEYGRYLLGIKIINTLGTLAE